jgi:hypothetical protein
LIFTLYLFYFLLFHLVFRNDLLVIVFLWWIYSWFFIFLHYMFLSLLCLYLPLAFVRPTLYYVVKFFPKLSSFVSCFLSFCFSEIHLDCYLFRLFLSCLVAFAFLKLGIESLFDSFSIVQFLTSLLSYFCILCFGRQVFLFDVSFRF